MERMEALLLEVRTRLERIEASLAPTPTCLRYPAAAKHLGVGLTKLKAMVKAGVLRTADVGGTPMVPLSELRRIGTPDEEKGRVRFAQRQAAWVPIPKRRR
jgi:hypothetical protein